MLAVDDLREKKGVDARRLVCASLELIRAAFRFTTGVFVRPAAQRDIKIRIRTVTTGNRGTDVWGQSTSEQDVVCLIEGKIDVRDCDREFTMQDPLSFFVAPRTGKANSVAPVPQDQLEKCIEETKIRAGKGGLRTGGSYEVRVFVSEDQDVARQAYDKLRAAGFPAKIETVGGAYGPDSYRVRILNLPEMEDARAVAARLRASGFGGAEAFRGS